VVRTANLFAQLLSLFPIDSDELAGVAKASLAALEPKTKLALRVLGARADLILSNIRGDAIPSADTQ
jgi:hypothetical protein